MKTKIIRKPQITKLGSKATSTGKLKAQGSRERGQDEEVRVDHDEVMVNYVNDCHRAGNLYRDQFKPRWDAIESQIRCVHPTAWGGKEDWQTKVFIPQQSKTSETAQAYLDKMLFGQKRFFGIQGTEERDKDEEGAIELLFDNVLQRGNFHVENDFVLNEACSGPGTSFIKITVRPDRKGLVFTWRSAYSITIDPAGRHKLELGQYMVDEYERPLQELIDAVGKGNSIYKKEKIQQLIDAAEESGRSLTQEALSTVKSFDGTAVPIDGNYRMVKIKEFWGMAETEQVEKDKEDPTKETKKKVWGSRIIAVANSKVLLRNDENDYGFIPIFGCRVKPRKYDYYGLGFGDNVVDLQELTNSMICLGFDSLKICSMDIALVDASKIKDPASIEYRPLAVWMLKGNPNEAVKLTRQGVSALGEIVRGLTILDQFQQEATGVLRQVQGAPQLSGGGDETLGEYQAKLAMIDNRFLKIARFIERDYIEPMLKGMFRILFNPKFFNQAAVDRVIGFKQEVSQDPNTGARIVTMKSKLNFDKIAQAGDSSYDFSAFGMTQFSKSIETLQKLKELLAIVVKTPQLQILFNIKELVKRTLRAAEIQDFEDLMKSDEEIGNIMNQIYSGQQAGAQAPAAAPGAQPAPAPAVA